MRRDREEVFHWMDNDAAFFGVLLAFLGVLAGWMLGGADLALRLFG